MPQQIDFKEISIDLIRFDADNPRRGVGTEEEDHQLLSSIQEMGILNPLIVCPADEDGYFIIDGVRRYRFAKELGYATVPCTVHPRLDSAERNVLRFQLQATFKPLTVAERKRQERRLRELGVQLRDGRAAA